MDAFSRTLAAARKEAETGRRKAWAAALAEMRAAQQKYEAEWQAETGLVPPRWRTIEELEAAIAWWQEQAAAVGIDPNRILDAGEEVLEFEPIIRGRLRLLRLQAAAVGLHEHLADDADVVGVARLACDRRVNATCTAARHTTGLTGPMELLHP